MKLSVLRIVIMICCCLFWKNADSQIHVSIRCMTDDCGVTESIKKDTVFDNQEHLDSWLRSLLAPLRANGYPSADFDAIERIENEVIAYLNPGPKIVLARIVPGNIDKKILEKIRFREKRYHNNVFNSSEIYKLLYSVAIEYANSGYPFAKTYLGDLKYENDTVEAVLYCESGPIITIDTIIKNGNLEINSDILFALAGIKPGDVYNYQAIKSLSSKLKKYNFIREIKPPEISFTENACVIYVFLDKRSVNTVDGIIGFMPDYQEEGKLFLTGELHFAVTNAMNLGEGIFVRWRQPERHSQTLKMGMTLPSVVLTPLGISWDFYLQKKDTAWISTDNKVLITYPGFSYAVPGAYVQYFSSSLLSVKQFQSTTTLPPVSNMKLVSLGLQFLYNKVNFIQNPRSGISLYLDCSAGKKTIIKNSALEENVYKDVELNSARVRAVADISYYIPLGKSSAIMFRTYEGMLFVEDVFENEMFRLGGLMNMRGFEEEQFYSTAFGLQTIEYRYLFSELSRLVVFADCSYIEKRTEETLNIQRPLSAGVGVTLETGSGLLSLFWAVGKMHKQHPDFKGSKIHFGYMLVF